MEIPGRASKPWFCNTTAESSASTAPTTTSAGQKKYFPATKPETALSASKIKNRIMVPPTLAEDQRRSWTNHGTFQPNAIAYKKLPTAANTQHAEQAPG